MVQVMLCGMKCLLFLSPAPIGRSGTQSTLRDKKTLLGVVVNRESDV
jgi:hypothetical protein